MKAPAIRLVLFIIIENIKIKCLEVVKEFNMTAKGIKSRQRVVEYGEVYTPEHIVKEMLDMVKDESYRIDSKFLEPAAGNGNFIVEILRRKLETASKLDLNDFDRNVFIAVSSIYAIDILGDNVAESKGRMISIIKDVYKQVKGIDIDNNFLEALEFVIDANIIHGDTIKGVTKLADNIDNGDILIIDWKMDGDNVVLDEYIFKDLAHPLLHDKPINTY